MVQDPVASLGFGARRRSSWTAPFTALAGMIATVVALAIGAVLAVFTAIAVAVFALCAGVVVFFAGFALRESWRRSPPMVEAFFVGNFAWMSATVGLVYQEAEAQLCLNYLADGQQRAGRGLVVVAIAAGAAWLAARRRALGIAPSPHRATQT